VRILSHIAAAFLLLVVTGGIWRVFPFDVVAPAPALVIAVFLGASVRGRVWECTIAALMIGYIDDVLSGAPRGLGAFVLGSVCLQTRVVTARLLVRGSLFISIFTFFAAVVAATLTLIARAAFGAGGAPLSLEVMSVVGGAFLTALVAPAVFRLCRGIDRRFARTEREREALRDGFLT
jgi:rod shape-determining protein MreD